MQFMVNISDFLMNQIKSYSWLNIENVPDGTQILKILRHLSKNWLKFSVGQPKNEATFSKNRLMKAQIFRKFQWFCWFFSKRTISRESWRASNKSFKGRGFADAGLNNLVFA
jgi:hypothetical protein